jgi:hypothetical protein
MRPAPEALYLDLLKKTLSFLLWPEPLAAVEDDPDRRDPLDLTTKVLARIVASKGLQLARPRPFTLEERTEGRVWPLYADTMIGLHRLDNLQHCVETVLRERIEGDLIECGVWRGGGSILMRGVLAAYGVDDRRVFVADSFQGLPTPEPDKYPADRWATLHLFKHLAVSRESVANNFRRYGLLDDQVVFLEGWFKDTLPTAPVDKLAVLRLDGDLYSSTMDTLTNLYHKVSDGGFIIIDDYALIECRTAVDEFRNTHNITTPMEEIDWSGRFWRKGAKSASE